MQKFLIERDVPGAGELSSTELQSIAGRSNDVLASMGPRAQWLQTYVTADRLYCLYVAEDEGAIREHARRGGFPASRVDGVLQVIDPTTADGAPTETVPAGDDPAPSRRGRRVRRLTALLALGALAAVGIVIAATTDAETPDPAQPAAQGRAEDGAVEPSSTVVFPDLDDPEVLELWADSFAPESFTP